MTVHVPRVASPTTWTGVAHQSELDKSIAGSPLGLKKISLQSWVVRFVTADIILLTGLGLAPTWLGHQLQPDLFARPFDGQYEAVAIALCMFLFSARIVRLYRTSRILEPRNSLQRTLIALLLTFAFLMALGAASKTTHVYSRLWFFSWLSASVVLLPAFRMMAIGWVRRALGKGHFVHRALSVGIGCEPLAAEAINASSKGLARAETPLRFKSIEELRALPEQISRHGIDKVYLTAPWSLSPEIGASLSDFRNISADVYLIPQAGPISSGVIGVQRLAGNVTLQIMDRPIDGWNYWLKRTQDVTVASVALFLLAPLLLLIAAAIKLESRGPVLFRQKRLGFNGQIFELWKFRSMYTELTDPDAATQTSKNDRRVTRVGRFLRRTSLDELPQLFNVLQGGMSIVGPRPHALQTTAEGKMLAEAIDNYASRHRVKPGITGWAQVHGLRGELTSIEQLELRVHYDREYIKRWSMLLDTKIIFMTLCRIANDPNAY